MMRFDVIQGGRVAGGQTAWSELFYRGNYSELLNATVDSPQGHTDDTAICYVIGALMFTGRLADALLLYDAQKEVLSFEDLVSSRFFLGIGQTRVSKYAEARAFFSENLRELRRKAVSHKAKFFIYQGLAFYRHFCCRYGAAQSAVEKSWKASFLGHFRYGQVLSSDLRGNTLVRVGKISEGIKNLSEAARYAEMLGHGGVSQAVVLHSANYRAQYGFSPRTSLQELVTLSNSKTLQDAYSQSSLNLELARQYALRGKLQESNECLENAGRIILSVGHRRQKAWLYHRYAQNAYLQGKFAESEAMLAKSEIELDPRIDLSILLEILGLREKVWKAQSKTVPPDFMERIVALTVKTGSGIGQNVVSRVQPHMKGTDPGDDPLGDLCSEISKPGNISAYEIEKVVAEGYWGLLAKIVDLSPGQNALYFELMPGTVAIFDSGSVDFCAEGVTLQMRQLALSLAQGKRSKKELVELLWGYNYQSFRHDPLLYALVNRLRRVLGKRSGWLMATKGGYAFSEEVRVVVYEHLQVVPSSEKRPLSERHPQFAQGAGQNGGAAQSNLNHRQLLILASLRTEEFIGVAQVIQKFDVSRMTATRDLSGLAKSGRVVAVGKARATKYTLPNPS